MDAAGQAVEAQVRALITGGVLSNHAVAEHVGLPVVDLQMLNVLALAGGALTPSQLADAMRLPRPTVTRIVRRLAAAGYVSTQPNPGDGRSKRVEVDTSRLRALEQEYRPQSERLAGVLEGFTGDEVATIQRFLGRLTAGPARGVTPPPAPPGP